MYQIMTTNIKSESLYKDNKSIIMSTILYKKQS